MLSGQCPKCGSTEVYTNKYMNQWTRMGSNWANTIPITGWYNATLDNYVCAACGYTENYISDNHRLDRIAQKWARASGDYARAPQLHTGGRSKTCPNCHASLPQDWKACPYCGQPMV